jgi:hypothetical protein
MVRFMLLISALGFIIFASCRADDGQNNRQQPMPADLNQAQP